MIPEALRWWSATPEGAPWLERLPRLVDECAAAWELGVGAPFRGYASFVARARRADGTAAVLKLNFPEPESEHEAAALEHYGSAVVLHQDLHAGNVSAPAAGRSRMRSPGLRGGRPLAAGDGRRGVQLERG